MFKKRITGVPLQVLVSACMYLGQIAVSFTVSWSGPNIEKLQDLEKTPLPYVLSDSQASFLASLLYIGGVPAPYLIGRLSNVKGRKPCFLLGGVLGTIGYTLLAASRSLAMLYCGRFVTGMSIGCLGVMILLYVGETASTNMRGILLTGVGIFNTFGSLILFSVASTLSYHATMYFGLALNVIFTLCSLMIPETPIYHVLKDSEDALKQILQDLGRLEDLDQLINSKKRYNSISNTKDWLDLFTIHSNKKALFILVSINMFQHCSGVMAIVFFSSTIFNNVGFSLNGNIAMIIIICFQLFGSMWTSIFIERIGRKILLNVSCVLCSLSMFTMASYFYLVHIENPVISNLKFLPLIFLIIFFVAYDSGLGIIPQVLIGEMFTPNTRSNGSATAITTSWITGFLVTTGFGFLFTKVGTYVLFWFFSAVCALAFVFSVIVIPETKGKSLLEIQEVLGKK